MKKICFVVCEDFVVKWFLRNHLLALKKRFEVSLITNTDNPNFLREMGIPVNVFPVKISREISLGKDFVALMKILKIFSKIKFNVVHSVTPKAGLLSTLSGFFKRVPVRIHTFTGQIWVTKKGFLRVILRLAEKLTSFLATHILVDSKSQREFLISHRQIAANKSRVLGEGSICGVDTNRFKFDPIAREQIRNEAGAKTDDFIFLFVGRFTRDKGFLDLGNAFSQLSKSVENIRLFLVGPDEQNMKDQVLEICKDCREKVHFWGFSDAPEKFMSAAEVLCLPSYREGFGSVILEAGAVGVPAIASKIYGLTDAIEENQTGIFHTPGNIDEMVEKMKFFFKNPDQRKKMGEAAKKRVYEKFCSLIVTDNLLEFYNNCLMS